MSFTSLKSLLLSAGLVMVLTYPLPAGAGEAMPPYQDSVDMEVSSLKTRILLPSAHQREMRVNDDRVSPKPFKMFMAGDSISQNSLKLLKEKLENPYAAFPASDASFLEGIRNDLAIRQFARQTGFAPYTINILNQLKKTSALEKVAEVLGKIQYGTETINF